MHGPSRGGGSHISSGSSGGSSFSGSSFSGSNGFYHGPRTIMFFGRPVLLSSGLSSLCTILVFFLIFVLGSCIFSGISFGQSNKEIKYMKEDSVVWEEIIENAQNGVPGYHIYTIEGIDFMPTTKSTFRDGYTFTGLYDEGENYEVATNYCLEYDDTDYYQIFYYFTDPDTGYEVTYYTYAQFEEPSNIHSLQIAYKIDSEDEILCINTSYSLNKCMEYIQAKDDARATKTMTIVFSLIGAALITGLAFALAHGIKKAKQQNALKLEKQKAEVEKAQAEADIVKEDLKQKHRYCSYCGSPIPEGENQCPACGSRIPKD